MASLHDDGYFDEGVAAAYDNDAADMYDPAVLEPAVDFLAGLAGDGRALELGIGTGRIALPLAARGVEVHGIDASAGHGRAAAGQARRPEHPGHHGRLRRPARRGRLPACLRGLQHLLLPAHPGRAGPLLPG